VADACLLVAVCVNRKCKKLYSILAAVKIDTASDTHIKGCQTHSSLY